MAQKVVVEETEEQRVRRWRMEWLLQQGIGRVHAAYLAAGRGDLAEIAKLKKQGCDDKLLVRIFRDLEDPE
jgi:hypothetical protein